MYHCDYIKSPLKSYYKDEKRDQSEKAFESLIKVVKDEIKWNTKQHVIWLNETTNNINAHWLLKLR